ncbi:MAG: PAS domain S-box protein, partial [candidate division Zixibacteria bacterium]|nr:PAS domain S-box protein [candidate division Zixibacteria bacterium]
KQALVSFEQGAEEVVSLETIDQSEYLRFMRPFIVEEGCLKCHAQQGYEIGDIRGGISVSVPMAPIYAESNNTIVKVMWGHLILWFLGILGFVLGATKVRKEFSKRLIVKEELQNSKDRFDQLAEQSSNFIWEVDVNGLYTYISHVVQKVLGYTPEELVGNKHFYDLHPEEGRKEFKTAAFEVFAQKERFEGMDNTIQAKDGSIKRISTNGIPLLNDDGTLLGYRGSDVDITEQKQAEEQLRASEERFKSILNTVQAGVVIIEEKTHEILFANPAAATMVQTSIENIVGKVCHEFICPAELGKCPISDLGQKIDNSEKKLLKVDGEELDILKTVNPIIINGKKCLVETFVDITNMKQAEGQLARNMESLREAKEIQEENNAKLVQSMADLERFNDMAVNRELRMIELKKEVNDMLLNKGSDAKYSIPVDADLAEDLP